MFLTNIKIVILFVISLFLTTSIYGQMTYEVNDFSDDYFGKIYISDTSTIYSPGWIAIYKNQSKTPLIKIKSDELVFEKSGSVNDSLQTTYDKCRQIIYQDFNFDGIKDFALMDGQNSYDHTPSYQIYLADNDKFTYNADFTRLAQEYCGMFGVDYEKKELHTMMKDGSAWCQYSTFKLLDGVPETVEVVEKDDTDNPFHVMSQTLWDNGSDTTFIKKTIDFTNPAFKIILSFELVKDKKKAILYSLNDSTLNYALLKPDSTVEFSYPAIYKSPDFEIDKKKNKLVFRNGEKIGGKTNYEIFQVRKKRIGINIITGEKVYTLIGDINTRQGSLTDIKNFDFKNVAVMKKEKN